MSGSPYHKRYHSDALAGFMSLSLEERGAYQTVLDMIYDRGGPIPDNERLLAGYMQCSVRKWKLIRETLILKGKISVTVDGLLTNSRAEKEIENLAKTSRKLIESGSKGGKSRANKEEKSNKNNESGQASLEAGLSVAQAIPDTRYSDTNVSVENDVDPVKILFDLGLKILTESGQPPGSARSIIGKWRKDYGDAVVIDALTDCRARAISNPVEWMPKRLAATKRDNGQDDFLGSMRRRYGTA